MQNDFGVGAGLENGAMPAQLVFQLAGIHKIAVVSDRNLTMRALDQDWLRIVDLAVAGSRIPHVADRDRARKFFERLLRERVGYMPHRLGDADLRAIRRRNPRTFLAPMLERVESEVGQIGGFGMTEDPKHSAFFS